MANGAMYCDPDTLRRKHGNSGLDLTGFGDTELEEICIEASDMFDVETDSEWQYQVIPGEELHDWNIDNQYWEGWPKFRPIRTLTRFDVMVSVKSGAPATQSIQVTPVETPIVPGALPIIFGDTFVDRNRGFVQTTWYLIRFGLFAAYPSLAVRPPQIMFGYTAGYDNGSVQSDGYSLPFPSDMVTAVAWLAGAIVSERMLLAEGMGGLESKNVGGVQMRRGTGPLGGSAFDIPVVVQRIINKYRQVTMR